VGECINRIDICENTLCKLYMDYRDYGKQGFEKKKKVDHIQIKKHMEKAFVRFFSPYHYNSPT